MSIQSMMEKMLGNISAMHDQLNTDIGQYVTTIESNINTVVKSTNSYTDQIQKFSENIETDINSQIGSIETMIK